MHIFSKKAVAEDNLRTWLAERYRMAPKRVLVASPDDAAWGDRYDVVCERALLSRGSFRLWLDIVGRDDGAWSPEEELEQTLAFVAEFDTQALMDDGTANPSSWVLVRPGEEPAHVYLDADLFDDHGCATINRVVAEEALGILFFPQAIAMADLRKHMAQWYAVPIDAIVASDLVLPASGVDA